MNKRKYKVNDLFFEKIDNELKAYWLGFIYADGCIMTHKNSNSKILELSLSKKDGEHVYKFAKTIGSTFPIHETKTNIKTSITSKKIYEDLIKVGVHERKSLTVIFPTEKQVPKHLMNHFLRGLFEGDGGFYYYKKENVYRINFCGTINICDNFKNYLNRNDISLYIPDHNKNYAELYLKGNNEVLKAAEQLYANSTIYLERKYEKYQQLRLLIKNEETNFQKRKNKSKSIEEEMIALHKNGLTGSEIAKIYNCSETNISRILKNYLKNHYEVKKNEVINLVKQGITNKSEIHRITGYSRDYIRKVIAQNDSRA